MMDEIEMELDVSMEEAKGLLSSRSVVGFWPRLRATLGRTWGPTDWSVLPAYGIAFPGGGGFWLEELAGGWVKGYHMLRGSLSQHGAHTLLRARLSLETLETFSVRCRVCLLLAAGVLVVWSAIARGTFFAAVFAGGLAVFTALTLGVRAFYAPHDRRAFIRLLERLFDGHVCGASQEA
jgi:hypothetical protein